MTPFDTFACNAEYRAPLRRFWHSLAGILGSPKAIYTHELMPYYDATTINEAEELLRTRIGPPASGFDELCRAELYGPRAWYIDDFADFISREPVSS